MARDRFRPGGVAIGIGRFTWYKPMKPGLSPANAAFHVTPCTSPAAGTCATIKFPCLATAPKPVQ